MSGYAGTFAVFLITGGRLGDLYGRRLVFILGMVGFVATNTLCGLAVTPVQLVLGFGNLGERAIQSGIATVADLLQGET